MGCGRFAGDGFGLPSPLGAQRVRSRLPVIGSRRAAEDALLDGGGFMPTLKTDQRLGLQPDGRQIACIGDGIAPRQGILGSAPVEVLAREVPSLMRIGRFLPKSQPVGLVVGVAERLGEEARGALVADRRKVREACG